MTNAQFIHVAQFYQTILCFSILALIGQRIVMMCRSLDQKYLKARARQFDDQMDWEKSFTRQKQILAQQQQQQRRAQQQRKRQEEQRRRQQLQRQNPQPPKQQNLRTSLVQNQNDRTDRKMTQDQQRPSRVSIQRKSLTDLRKSQQVLQKQIQIKDEITSKISDSSDEKKSSQRKQSTNSVKKQGVSNQEKNNQIRNKTINLEGSQLNNGQMNNQQPSINPHDEQTQEDRLQKQYKDAQKVRYFVRVDAMFNQYIPILMSMLVIGIMTHSTYIFTMVCFFGYIFTSLLFNYANLLSKLKHQPTQSSIFSKANKLIAGLFIIALFLNYWFDSQF